MRKKATWLLLFLLFCSPLLSQTSVVTASISDPDGTAWASLNGYNATYTITLVNSSGVPVPAGQAYRNDTGVTVTNPAAGNLDSTGTFSLTLVSNSNIRPSGTQWQFRFCPAVSSGICNTVTMAINASGTYSTQLSAGASSPRISGGVGAYAYNDTEVSAVANNSYLNITTPACRYYSTSWGSCGGGGGGTTTNALTLNNSGSGAPSGTTFNGSAAVTLSYDTIGAASSGANSNITSLSGLTTPLSAAQGGLGAASLTGYLYGNGNSAATSSTTIPNSGLANPSSTVNGQTCTLGSTCTITAAPSGTITISQGGTNATSAAAGTMPNATSSTASNWTTTPTLGASGTTGSLTLGNATSGLLTIAPVTGALGTITASFPANTGTVAETNLAQTFSAAQVNSTNGAASTPAMTYSGSPYTGGTGTTNFPLFYLNDGTAPTTFSTAGTFFGVNAPSGFSGNFIDLRVNGAVMTFNVNSSGGVVGQAFEGPLFEAAAQNTSTLYQGGHGVGASSSVAGSGVFSGGTNSGSGGAGSATLLAGTSTNSGAQGFANIEQSFTSVALATTFNVVSMSTTVDQVLDAPLASNLIVGVALTTGGTVAYGTYTSGITATGTTGQTCALTSFNDSSTATATVALTGTNTIAGGTALVITLAGGSATAAPTSATAGNGTATCSGTATIVTGLGTVNVVSNGKTTVRFDGTPTVGDVACGPPASTGTAGLAHDNSTSSCTFGQGLGIITGQVSGSGSGATATVLLQIAQ